MQLFSKAMASHQRPSRSKIQMSDEDIYYKPFSCKAKTKACGATIPGHPRRPKRQRPNSEMKGQNA